MIVGFSQEIPYKWNNILTCAIGAILLLATCSLLGITLLVCLGVTQQLVYLQRQRTYDRHNSPSTPSREQKRNSGCSGGSGGLYETPVTTTPGTPSSLSCSSATPSASYLGVSPDATLVVGLKCAIGFSWVLPTLYCVILWLIRHVMHTHSTHWWLRWASVECNLLVVNQTLLAVIFYVVLGFLIRRLGLPKTVAAQKKCNFGGSGSSSGGGIGSVTAGGGGGAPGKTAALSSSTAQRYVSSLSELCLALIH